MFVDQILEHAALRAPDAPALVFGSESVSFAELQARVERRVAALEGLAEPGARVALLGENSIEYVEMLYAVPRAGMVAVPLNYRLHPQEWAGQIERVEAALLVGSPEYLARASTPGRAWSDVIHDAPGPPPRRGADDDVAWVLFTSGTTGRPKGAMLTHRNLVAGTISGAFGRRVLDHDVTLFAFPLCHIAAYNVLIHHLHARTVVLVARFETGDFLRLVPQHAVTTATLAPTMIDMLLEHPDLAATDLSTLRLIGYGSAPIPRSVLRRAFERLGCDFSQGYGMTELSGNAVFLDDAAHRRANDGDERLARAAGRATPVVAIRVVDDEGRDVAAGTIGEVVARGDQVTVGYWRDEDATAAALRGGWLHTGDLGRLDADGLLTIVDRKKDVIVSGGENVASREVEQVLEQHPGVREVAVVGVPDDRWGEAVCAVVVSTDDDAGRVLDAPAIVQLSRDHLAGYKKPRHVLFVDELPKNANGKVDKRAVRELAREQVGSRG